MYLKTIEKNNTVAYRSDFYKIKTDPTRWELELLNGQILILKTAPESPTYELWDGAECLDSLTPPNYTELDPNDLYSLYSHETGKSATYIKKDQELEYRDYTRWLAKKQKQQNQDDQNE